MTLGTDIYWFKTVQTVNYPQIAPNDYGTIQSMAPSMAGASASYSFGVSGSSPILGQQYILANQKALERKISAISVPNYSSNFTTLNNKLDAIPTTSYQSSFDGVNTKLDSIMTTLGSGSGGGSSNDYTDALSQLAQLVAWTDVLMIVLIVLWVVMAGVYVGSQVTKWLKART